MACQAKGREVRIIHYHVGQYTMWGSIALCWWLLWLGSCIRRISRARLTNLILQRGQLRLLRHLFH